MSRTGDWIMQMVCRPWGWIQLSRYANSLLVTKSIGHNNTLTDDQYQDLNIEVHFEISTVKRKKSQTMKVEPEQLERKTNCNKFDILKRKIHNTHIPTMDISSVYFDPSVLSTFKSCIGDGYVECNFWNIDIGFLFGFSYYVIICFFFCFWPNSVTNVFFFFLLFEIEDQYLSAQVEPNIDAYVYVSFNIDTSLHLIVHW